MNFLSFHLYSSDLRAKLEVAIETVLTTVRLSKTFSKNNHGYKDEDEDDSSSVPTSDNEEVCLEKKKSSSIMLRVLLFRKIMIKMLLSYLSDKILHQLFVHYLNMVFMK